MHTCRSCNRHLIHEETACPFCGSSQPSSLERSIKRVGTTVLSVLTPMVLAACYGPPMKSNESLATDSDADGYDALVDCDDANADVHPDATEDCADTIDNDCDGATDADDTDCQTP